MENSHNFSSFIGFKVNNQDLQVVAELSGVLEAPDDFLSFELRTLFNDLLPEPENVQCNEFVQKYLLLKQKYQDSISEYNLVK